MQIELSFKELVPLIAEAIRKGLVPFIWGPPGLGKTALTRTIAKELKKEYRTLDAPLFQPTDYAVPVPDRATKSLELYRTGFIPLEGDFVVSIEDLPHAKTYQQVPLMQIILDRRIGPFQILKGVSFIATGNREEDLAFTQPISSPLLNRFCHFYMRANPEEWAELYARPSGLDERVVMFNLAMQQYHHRVPKEGVHAYATPRTMEFFSKLIQGVHVEGAETRPERERLQETIRVFGLSSIGDEATAAFMTWYKYLRDISPKEIVQKGELPKTDPADRSQMFTIILSVATYIRSLPIEDLKKNVSNISSLVGDLPADYKTTFFNQLCLLDPKTGKKDSRVLEVLCKAPQMQKSTQYLKDLLMPEANRKTFAQR